MCRSVCCHCLCSWTSWSLSWCFLPSQPPLYACIHACTCCLMLDNRRCMCHRNPRHQTRCTPTLTSFLCIALLASTWPTGLAALLLEHTAGYMSLTFLSYAHAHLYFGAVQPSQSHANRVLYPVLCRLIFVALFALSNSHYVRHTCCMYCARYHNL